VWGGAAATLAGLAGAFALLELPPGVVAAVAFLSLAVTALEKTFNPTESRARKARLEADFKHLAWQAQFALNDVDPDTADARKLTDLRERLRELERQRDE
jgi:hypothetical protein